jgi:hypothetical protein
MVVALMVFCFAFPGDERPPSDPVGPRPPDLGLGGVNANLNALGGGVGEHVRQGFEPHAGLAGDGKPARGQQRPDLMDRTGDG